MKKSEGRRLKSSCGRLHFRHMDVCGWKNISYEINDYEFWATVRQLVYIYLYIRVCVGWVGVFKCRYLSTYHHLITYDGVCDSTSPSDSAKDIKIELEKSHKFIPEWYEKEPHILSIPGMEIEGILNSLLYNKTFACNICIEKSYQLVVCKEYNFWKLIKTKNNSTVHYLPKKHTPSPSNLSTTSEHTINDISTHIYYEVVICVSCTCTQIPEQNKPKNRMNRIH